MIPEGRCFFPEHAACKIKMHQSGTQGQRYIMSRYIVWRKTFRRKWDAEKSGTDGNDSSGKKNAGGTGITKRIGT